MTVLEYGSEKIVLDDEGYLNDYHDWNEKIACGIAEREGIDELTGERLDIIRFIREYYEKYRAFPILGSVCKSVHQPKDCVNEDFIDPLIAWKIAGLPKPSEEVISYLKR